MLLIRKAECLMGLGGQAGLRAVDEPQGRSLLEGSVNAFKLNPDMLRRRRDRAGKESSWASVYSCAIASPAG